MRNSREDPEAFGWSEMRSHQDFLELSALATSGDLTEEEQKVLAAHLAACEQCRQALQQFEAVVDVGVPHLAPRLAQGASEPRESAEPGRDGNQSASGSRVFAFAHNNGHRPGSLNWNYVWLPFAACIVLSLALASYTYKVGKSRRAEVAANAGPRDSSGSSSDARIEALEQQISDAAHDRQSLNTQGTERERLIADLRRKIEEQSAALEQMKATQAGLEQSVASDEQQKQRLAEERNSLAQRLETAEASVRETQARLESAQQQRSSGDALDTSLAQQIKDLNAQLRDREQTIDKQDELLAHDRDIRDLMGARDLYIAEVYDVGHDAATEKPCGRVFYTKGKSLVFYAYDLDQQPGVRNARTFQAWGRRGADLHEALNLGVFYEDNAAKKRWVLKFDDEKTLEQIDAVFVTVEPNGGSAKPSGKPLLFAYLKIDPNHP